VNTDHISIPVNSDALEILNEVQNIMEEETKSKLPDIPNSINDNAKYSSKKNEHLTKKIQSIIRSLSQRLY
jgi:hypothetical protein